MRQPILHIGKTMSKKKINNSYNEVNDVSKIALKDLLEAIISVLLVLAVMLFGFIYIKNAADDLNIFSEGYRNLYQVNIYAGIKNARGIILDVDDEYIYIVTSKHLVSDENNVSVEFGNKARVDSEVIYYYKDMDASIIRISKEDSNEYLKGAKATELYSKSDYENISISRHVFYSNSIYDTEKSFEEGIWIEGDSFIYELQAYVGLFSGTVTPGMSGEGLYDENGKLIGMIVAASETQGAVIPAYKLRNEYMQWKVAE